MDKFMQIILPKDVLLTIFKYLKNHLFFEGVRFPIHEYIQNTYVKNIGYMKNEHTLIPNPEEIEELDEKIRRLILLCEDYPNGILFGEAPNLEEFRNVINTSIDLVGLIKHKNNTGMLKYLHRTGRFPTHGKIS